MTLATQQRPPIELVTLPVEKTEKFICLKRRSESEKEPGQKFQFAIELLPSSISPSAISLLLFTSFTRRSPSSRTTTFTSRSSLIRRFPAGIVTLKQTPFWGTWTTNWFLTANLLENSTAKNLHLLLFLKTTFTAFNRFIFLMNPYSLWIISIY